MSKREWTVMGVLMLVCAASAQTFLGFDSALKLGPGAVFRVPVILSCDEPVAGLQFEIYDLQADLRLDSVRTTPSSSHFSVRWLDKKILLFNTTGGGLPAGRHMILDLFIHLENSASDFDSLGFQSLVVIGSPAGKQILPVTLGGELLDLRYSTEVAEESARPVDYALHPVYPNPFNATATLIIDLAQAGRVDVGLYDLVGHRLRTILNEPKEAGTHRLMLAAGGLSSGIYWCRLQVNGIQRVQKIILLR
jgi:hypothetical protein